MKKEVERHFDHIAKLYDKFKEKNRYYYDDIKKFLDMHVPKGSRVLEVGCGTGELLNHVQPSEGCGIDISAQMIKRAKEKFPHLNFQVSEVENLPLNNPYDYVLMIDLLDHIHDIWDVLKGLETVVRDGSLLCIATINPVWQPIFDIAEKFHLKMPEGPHNFVRTDDIVNLLEIFDYRIVKKQMRFLIPKKIPIISDAINFLASYTPGLKNLCAVQTIVAKKVATTPAVDYSCTVVIPCHNEEGNVDECVRTVPQIGKGTQLIFVDDASTDSTLAKLRVIEKNHSHVKVISYPDNKGKGFAVQQGGIDWPGTY